jgi:hypothetical protein
MAFGVIDKDGKKPTRYFSKKQESKIAEAVEGQRVPNSGATAWVKGDVLAGQFLLEAKTKTSNSESISIKRDWFLKNKEEAAFMGKSHQAIVFNFGPDYPYNENHYIIDEYLFLELLEYLKGKKE